MKREQFSSRLGFLLISAGCAIGIGNVWRFPYITGQYGGAAFVLVYLFFLVVLGLPIIVMEFAVGRASHKSVAMAFRVLEPPGQKWHIYGYVAMCGNYLLMMFYTTVSAWMLIYFYKTAAGQLEGLSPSEIQQVFPAVLANPWLLIAGVAVVILIGFGVCSLGLKSGVERVTKAMMICLLAVMLLLVVNSMRLPGAMEGLRFYLMPDFQRMKEAGLSNVVFAAMGQAFFTLSIGAGSMTIFGSYLSDQRSLTGESITVTLLDTFVALLSGLIIFPACSAFSVEVGAGPGLVFMTLPNIFNQMAGGRVWGALFFVFMSFAALSTVIAVFENIVSFGIDLWGWSRKKTVLVNIVLIFVLSLPCVLGHNLWSWITPLGAGTSIQDLEDFVMSNNLLPIGSIVYLLFCTSRYGWGWNSFTAETDKGTGIRFPRWARGYVTYVLPVIILVVFVQGYWDKFFA